METFGAYVLSVIAAAMICSVVTKLSGKAHTHVGILRFVCGLVMAAVIVSPLGKWDLPDLSGYFNDLEDQVAAAVAVGTDTYCLSYATDIRQRTEAYIQEKAKAFGAELEVVVVLDDGTLPVPVAAEMTGMISPAIKASLERILEEELGIRKENQRWK